MTEVNCGFYEVTSLNQVVQAIKTADEAETFGSFTMFHNGKKKERAENVMRDLSYPTGTFFTALPWKSFFGAAQSHRVS